MTEPLDNACNEIVNVVATVVTPVPVNPPEKVTVPLIALVFPEDGDIGIEAAGLRKSLHNIAIYVMHKRVNIPTDIAAIKPYIDSIPRALLTEMTPAGTQFNNSIATFERVTYKFEFLTYAAVDYVVYHFVMQNVKILVNYS